MLSVSDVEWAVDECETQLSGERSVYNLCCALVFARSIAQLGDICQIPEIEVIGKLVEPSKNNRGFREVPVHFFDLTQALPAHQIVSSLTSLIENGDKLTPAEWYIEFERIHPFVDGNGRVGSILFNAKNGSLHNPVKPPNVFAKAS